MKVKIDTESFGGFCEDIIQPRNYFFRIYVKIKRDQYTMVEQHVYGEDLWETYVNPEGDGHDEEGYNSYFLARDLKHANKFLRLVKKWIIPAKTKIVQVKLTFEDVQNVKMVNNVAEIVKDKYDTCKGLGLQTRGFGTDDILKLIEERGY